MPTPEVVFASGVNQPTNVSPGDFVVKVAVSSVPSCAVTATVYLVPEYGFVVEVHVVFAPLSDPASVEPSLPVTFTEARVPSVTVTSTVMAAFFAAARADAVDVPSEASADPLQPVRTTAAGTAPRAASIPRRDHLSGCRPDRFDMYGTPTAHLPEISTFAGASCASYLG
jgi:hypothetical protein